MKSISITTDKVAIGLSAACALHCLALPLFLVIAPSLAASLIGSEDFHHWMLVAVLPTSLIALTLGCRKHHNVTIAMMGLSGLVVLTLAAFFAHDALGENAEKVASLIGASLIGFSHWRNHSLCRKLSCDCKAQSPVTNPA